MERTRPPIGEVLQYYGLKSIPMESGQRKVRCPFHGDDRNPSASVHFEKDLFHCFTCGMQGDSFALIMEKEGMGFAEAREFAARVFGGSYGQVQRGHARQRRRRVFEDERPDPGQSSLFQARVRRRPFAGS